METNNKIIINEIERKLKILKYSNPSKKEYDHLINLETEIQNIKNRENEARSLLTKNNISISNLCKQIKITRQTIYNNPILASYIELSNNEFKKEDISKHISSQDEHIRLLKQEVNLKRSLEIELAYAHEEIDSLKNEVAKLKKLLNIKQDNTINCNKTIS